MKRRYFLSTIFILLMLISFGSFSFATPVAQANDMCGRTVFADVVALDQPFYYNRL
jgi:hypothetical protein